MQIINLSIATREEVKEIEKVAVKAFTDCNCLIADMRLMIESFADQKACFLTENALEADFDVIYEKHHFNMKLACALRQIMISANNRNYRMFTVVNNNATSEKLTISQLSEFKNSTVVKINNNYSFIFFKM